MIMIDPVVFNVHFNFTSVYTAPYLLYHKDHIIHFDLDVL